MASEFIVPVSHVTSLQNMAMVLQYKYAKC